MIPSFALRPLARSSRGYTAIEVLIAMTVMAISYSLLWFYAAIGRRLLREDADDRVVAGISRSYLPGPWIYLTATLVAFVSPKTSIGLFGAIAAFYMLESSLFAKEAT